jgi:hypothetical protein
MVQARFGGTKLSSGCDRIRSMVENSTGLTSADERSSRQVCERPDAGWTSAFDFFRTRVWAVWVEE